MTVKELIEKLQQLKHQDAQVCIYDVEGDIVINLYYDINPDDTVEILCL